MAIGAILAGVLPALIGGGISAIGGYMQSKADQEADKANKAAHEKANDDWNRKYDFYRASNDFARKEWVDASNYAYADYVKRAEAQDQITTTTVNFEKMVADARAAGLNPLTVIRNGGMAGFTSVQSPKLILPMQYEQMTYTPPMMDFGPYRGEGHSPAGAAMSAFGQGVQNMDLIGAISAQTQQRLVNAQIAAGARAGFGTAPAYTATAGMATGGNTQAFKAASVRTLQNADGSKTRVGLGSPADDWTGEFGEGIDVLEGAPRYVRDRIGPTIVRDWNSGVPGKVLTILSPLSPATREILMPFVDDAWEATKRWLTPTASQPIVAPTFMPFSPTGPNWRPRLVR